MVMSSFFFKMLGYNIYFMILIIVTSSARREKTFGAETIERRTQISFVKLDNGDDCNISDHSRSVIANVPDANYKNFIQNSDTWIDKSLLMERLIENEQHKVFIITAPKRSGKSLNMQMIRLLVSIPVDYYTNRIIPEEDSFSYAYFRKGEIIRHEGKTDKCTKPLISKRLDILDTYGTKRPVIFLDGVHIDPKDFFDMMREKIRCVYMNNYYLNDKLINMGSDENLAQSIREKANLYKKRFDTFTKKTLLAPNQTEMEMSLKYLSEMLFFYHQKKVWIFYDEFENFLQTIYFDDIETFSAQEISCIKNFVRHFISNTFRQNPYLEKGILTGILRVQETTYLSNLNFVEELSVLGKPDTFPFYGVYDYEFDTLMARRNMPKYLITMAKKLYNGYASLGHPEERMYCVFVIMKFVNAVVIEYYWTQTAKVDFLQNLIQQQGDFATKMATLIDLKTSVPMNYHHFAHLTLIDCQTIRDIRLNTIPYETKYDSLIFGFLSIVGFFSFRGFNTTEVIKNTTIIRGKLANEEVMEGINEDLNSIIFQNFDSSYFKTVEKAAQVLQSYMESDEESLTPTFGQLVQKIFEIISKMGDLGKFRNFGISGFQISKENVVGSEASIRLILSPIFGQNMFRCQTSTTDPLYISPENDYFWNRNTTKDGVIIDSRNRQKMDLFMWYGKRALIVEYKFAQHRNNISLAFQQSLNYTLLFNEFEEFPFEVVKYMAIRVSDTNVVEIRTTTKHKSEVIKLMKDLQDRHNRQQILEKINKYAESGIGNYNSNSTGSK